MSFFLYSSSAAAGNIGGFYNVVAYGASGTGVPDDLAAINSAVAASGGKGVIFFPAGSYKVSGTISSPSNSTLIFAGAGLGASNIFGTFNGFVLDTFTNPYGPTKRLDVIGLNITNGFGGDIFSVSTATSTVTTSIASPGVVNWTGHNFTAGSTVSFSVAAGGTLPTGITANTPYYVIATGLTANSFQISATAGGAAINFTGTSSGTQTGVTAWPQSASPLSLVLSGTNPGIKAGGALWVPSNSGLGTNCVFVGMITDVSAWPRIVVSSTSMSTVGTSVSTTSVLQCYSAANAFVSSGTVTTPIASPGVVNWTGSNLQAGAGVSFSGGVLPTGIVSGTTYYVLSTGLTANSFQIAATPGGTAINFTGSSSGTQTGLVTLQIIPMAISKPSTIGNGQYYVYNYEDYLADPRTDFPIGVATWDTASNSLIFTGVNRGSIVGGSSGSSDRLWLAPVAGCIRMSSVNFGSVEKCALAGFYCVQTTQDKCISFDATEGGAEGFHVTVVDCNLSNLTALSGSMGQTGIYFTNNGIASNISASGLWCAIRMSGTSSQIIGGRFEVNYFGFIVGSDFTPSNGTLTGGVIRGMSMESNLQAIYVKNGNVTIEDTGCSCNVSYQALGGFYLNGYSGVLSNIGIFGHFGSGYGLYLADGGTRNVTIDRVSSGHIETPSQSWRLPSYAYWGVLRNTDAPAQTYNYSTLPGVGANPAAVEGDEYNINDSPTAASGNFATNVTVGGGSNHVKVRYNGTNWKIVG